MAAVPDKEGVVEMPKKLSVEQPARKIWRRTAMARSCRADGRL